MNTTMTNFKQKNRKKIMEINNFILLLVCVYTAYTFVKSQILENTRKLKENSEQCMKNEMKELKFMINEMKNEMKELKMKTLENQNCASSKGETTEEKTLFWTKVNAFLTFIGQIIPFISLIIPFISLIIAFIGLIIAFVNPLPLQSDFKDVLPDTVIIEHKETV